MLKPLSLKIDGLLNNFTGGSAYDLTPLGLKNEKFCAQWGASIFEASETASGVSSAMYSDEYIQDEVEVIIKKIFKVNFESDLSEAVVKKLFFGGKSKWAPERVI
ncbi:hypothetical protein Hanom_Chr16g01420051 [Helianthus anomalus]